MYKHTQIGWVVIIAALIIMIVMPLLLCKGYAILNACISLIIGALLFLLFSVLTVTVDNELIRVSFGIGLITIKIALKDAVSCKPMRNKWWWGWGIHGYPGKCWLLNVSGLDAVELVMKSGMKYFIGTDEPDKLCEAIRLSGRML
jgi:hypothetical protein